MQVPCGQCIGCRLERSRQWALRIQHESEQHARSSFLTLTYETDPVSLDVDDLQRFFKRVRKSGLRVRHYSCGEYGSRLSRPHFHVCLFGEDFLDDSQSWSKGLWISPRLEELWGHGYCVAGSLSFESAAYVARYVTKKITGDDAIDHYTRVDELTGEVHAVRPEFSVMSRGGRSAKGQAAGIGADWWRRFGREVARDDSCLARGHESKPPRYYDELLERVDAAAHQAIKDRRRALARSRAADNSDDRLVVREKVLRSKLNTKGRSYETGRFLGL